MASPNAHPRNGTSINTITNTKVKTTSVTTAATAATAASTATAKAAISSKSGGTNTRAQSRARRGSRAHNFTKPSSANALSLEAIDTESGYAHAHAHAHLHSSPHGHDYLYSPTSQRIEYPVNPRAPSPSGLSRVSASSSVAANGPQLRKKPRSISIKNDPRPDSSGSVKSRRDSLTHTSQDAQAKVNSSVHNPANSSKPLSHSNSDSSQQHSPVYKRAPASHSSYGVETTIGPPSAYTTQRTFSQERIRKPDRNTIIWNPQTPGDSSAAVGEASEIEMPSTTEQTSDSVASLTRSSIDTAETYSIPTPAETDPMANITIRGQRPHHAESTEDESKTSGSEDRKSEDLFLNIAKVDAARPTTSRTEKRRSRISLPFLSASRSTQDNRLSPARSRGEIAEPTPAPSEISRYYSKRSSLGAHVPGALSRTHHQDGYRPKEQSIEPNSDAELSDRQYARRHSNANADTVRLTQRSSQALRGQKYASEMGYEDQPKAGETIATESTVSTAAPSTVWDELDDLKSRIRKLELTGKLPPSSAAAMSSAERPRTATTTATTMSSMSPKYQPAGATLQSSMEGISSSVHPLLHEAMGNAKQVLSNDVYQKLYATASDALQLAAMMSTDAQSSVSYSTAPINERLLKRRTESMCRGLTELAIALTAESKLVSANVRPGSRESSLPPSSMLRSRRYSNDPGDRPVSSRVTSRLENRRTSLHTGHPASGLMSPENGFRGSPTALPQLSGTRLSRTTAGARTRRMPGYYDGADDESDASPSVRPPSSAQTDLNAYRRTLKDQAPLSRDGADHHVGLTGGEGHGPVSTNFVSRRKYASPGSVASSPQDSTPITPREGWGRISTMANQNNQASSETPSDTIPDVHHAGRAGSTRRSLGFAGRIGSSVGSRLRAVRAERKEITDNRSPQDIASSIRGDRYASMMDDNGQL